VEKEGWNYDNLGLIWWWIFLENTPWFIQVNRRLEDFYKKEDINNTVEFYKALKKAELEFNLTNEELDEIKFDYKQKKDGFVDLKVS
jgi:hypothetical protein